MNKLIPTAGYVRVSHDEQAKHGFSIEAQKEGLQKYANEKGYIIVDWYIDEGKSARKNKSKRKEYLRLIEDAQQGKFEMIIFKCIDRWFRNISEYYQAQDILDKKGVNWECSDEEYDTTTRDGRWKLHIYLMLAQDEADKGSERINYVFEHKVKNKEAITGSQPYGFIVKEIDGYKRVVKDTKVMAVVQDIFAHFELYHSKRATLFYVQDKHGVDIDYNLITKVLTNPIYYGKYKNVEDYVWDEPYISKARYEKIQVALTKNVKVRKNKIEYIFPALLKCTGCGGTLVGSNTIKTINKAGEKRLYTQYRCNNAYTNGRCNKKASFSEKKIEEQLIQCIEEEVNNYICEYELSLKKAPAPKINTKAIKEEMDRLNIQYRKNRITEQEYDYEYERLEKRLEAAEKEQPKERDLSPLHEFLNSGWKNIYHTLQTHEKRALWRSVIHEMQVDVKTKQFTIEFI